MTFQQLNYFIEVHKAGSFSQAAKNLYITQSAISNAIIGLEKEIGEPIFVRSQYGLSLTPRGEDVLRHAERICESMQKITNSKPVQKKCLRIGCGNYPPVARAYIRMLREYQGRPDVELSLEDSRFGSFVKRVVNNELDIAFYFKLTSYSEGTKESLEQEGLEYEEYAVLPSAVCIGPKHPLYNKEDIQMSDFRPYPLLDTSKSGVSNARILSAFIPVSKSNLVIVSGFTVRRKVLEEGLAYQITHLCAEKDRVPGFRYIPIEGLSHTFYSITNPKMPHSQELQQFIAYLKEEIAKEPK